MNKYFKLINFIIFQILWFVLILGKNDYFFIGLILLGLHFYLVKAPLKDVKLVIAVTLLGTFVDSALTFLGVFIFDEQTKILLVPLWLVIVWAGFAITLNHSLSYFKQRYWLCAVAGAVGGPASYLAGQRLGAVILGPSTLESVLVLSGTWGLLFPLAVWLSSKFQAESSVKKSFQS